jgi:Glycerate kinase
MAAASGLMLVPPTARNPLLTTSYGTGELIRHALDAGVSRIIVGIGGSATNDGGAGMLQALGATLLDEQGRDLAAGGGALSGLARIDLSGVDPRLQRVSLDVACDVTNPLLGEQGASAVFGPQKGASPEMVAQLDANLAHYAGIISRDLGKTVAAVPGAGAAGGMGAALLGPGGQDLFRH